MQIQEKMVMFFRTGSVICLIRLSLIVGSYNSTNHQYVS